MSAPLPPPERVLPTLNADGTRRRVRPELSRGRFEKRRLIVGWGLIALFVGLPFLTLGGKPAVLLDLPAREFTLFGRTFLPTDTVLLMLLMLSIFIAIFWITALVGRAWCGWACPQTVYMEFLFRPVERLFEGSRAKQLKLDQRGGGLRRVAKNVVFLVLSFLVANVFLAYFVGVSTLGKWMTQSPFEHPTPFVVMSVTAALVLFDFGYFREQMCTVICPYARLQSVLLDGRSLIVGYDTERGEPRAKGKPRPGVGDCIDCGACVRTCPTGIDIREGLQLECIACAQCIDACDAVMDKIKKPIGLIRYGSQSSMEKGSQAAKLMRPRVLVYPALLLITVTALLLMGRSESAEVTVLRGLTAPYVLSAEGVRNQIRVKVRNRSGEKRAFEIALEGLDEGQLIAPENPLEVEPGRQRTTTVFVVAPRHAFSSGNRPVQFAVTASPDFEAHVHYKLLGPKEE